ncbi:PucR family transcriptional regulator [Clostridium oryzae]|uniref:Purine catabolism regulatory protein-like family protein n=1 Tax=Clostridium oryzae TaxID=1450648 RepID=A0A1V4IND2_9CLOT|nr:PucR family transcriptional regulator [Clostridium oryzae]OPJ61562.1 purine catabolism regulatory protein-like family protein [Clostridium oryzae]
MPITVNEALELDILDGFKVIAGKKGLSNKIYHVAVWDYEIGNLIAENFSRGDFALSTLVAIRDNIDKLYDNVEIMIKIGISCLAIKNIYFDYIPDNVIDLANKNNFPIMLFNNTYTEDIIVYVNKAIDEKNEYENLASKIDYILNNNLDELSIKKVAHKINIHFKEKNIVAFCKKKSMKLKAIINFSGKEVDEILSKVIPYRNGYIVINTFQDIDQKDIENAILRRLKWWGFNETEYVIGISSLYNDLGDLNNSVQESLYAFRYSMAYKRNISFFHEIGISRILFPMLDNPWLLKYYKQMIEPLIDYDKINETELLKTAIKYVENNGDIKLTAEELFQHGNTVRYRIDKIQKIICENYKSQHFYEELAVAVRIYTLLDASS